MKPTIQNFRLWLDNRFREGKINNISLTQHWIDGFIEECNTKQKQSEVIK